MEANSTLQPQELMIGNYVLAPKSDEFDLRVCKVFEIRKRQFRLIELVTHLMFDQTSVQPIPLTEQWLKDFGFTTKEDCEGLYKGDMIYYNGFISFGQTIKITYVHQLQNLYFALTHTKLTL